MTAPATTGPKSDPRPTSSTPATSVAPEAQASFSYFRVHFSRLSRRILSVPGEYGSPVAGLIGMGGRFLFRLEGMADMMATLLRTLAKSCYSAAGNPSQGPDGPAIFYIGDQAELRRTIRTPQRGLP